MLLLKGKNLTDCKALRTTLYAKLQAGTFTNSDLLTAHTLMDRFCFALDLGVRSDYLLDMKCGIIFTKSEQKQGIINLHNHG